jgi:PhnB protein
MEPYLTFHGDCADALAFYAECLGGKVVFSMPFAGSPADSQVPAGWKHKILHARLEARGRVLMASDCPPGQPVTGHHGFALSVPARDVEDGRRLFDALGAGGQVTMPYAPTFWSPGFGMLVDRFGVPWMVNVEAPPPGA